MNPAPATGDQDLFEAVDALARLAGGPVAVEDLDFRVLAYSAVPGQRDDEARRSAILGRRMPARWLRWMTASGMREQLREQRGPVRLDLPWATDMPRFIQPVRHAGHVVGYVWLMRESAELPEKTTQILRDFAELFASDLAEVSRRSVDGPDGRALAHFLAGALSATGLAQMLDCDEATTAVVVLAVDTASGARTASTGDGAVGAHAVTTRADATRALRLYAKLQLPTALVTSEPETTYVLMAAPAVTERMLDTAMEGVAAQLRSVVGPKVLVAAGAIHTGVAQVVQSRHEADQTLHALRGRAGSTCGRYDEMGYEIVVRSALDAVRDLGPVVSALLARLGPAGTPRHDEQLRTLTAYLDEGGDVRAAAAQLQVHPNTLRYRLRRIEQLAGVTLRDPHARLALDLVRRAAGATGGGAADLADRTKNF